MSVLTPPTLKDANRWKNLRVGLLGGSFNPAHAGHYHIARLAMAEYNLDFVWWLVTPQNPLKDKAGMASYAERFESVRRIIGTHPRMMATHLEAEMGTSYSYETVKGLLTRFPATDFLFLCGMDNAMIFHKWDRWRGLSDMIDIAFIARPPAGRLVRNCPVRMRKNGHVSWLNDAKMLDISSTKIRKSLLDQRVREK